MNFKVNLFFLLYETHITSLGIPISTVPRVSDGAGYNGKNKFALKCFAEKIKCFKTMLILFFFNGKLGHRGPTQPT